MLSQSFGKQILTMISLITLGALVTGCAGGGFSAGGDASVSSSSLNGATPGEIAKFQSTFWQFANSRGCVQCHGGNTPEPAFASADLGTAFSAAIGYQIGSSSAKMIDFTNPDASIILVYAGNAHCGVGACSDPSIRPTVQALLEDWASYEVSIGRKNSGALPTYMTSAVTVPASIPSSVSTTVTYMQFPLSGLNPSVASMGNAILQVQVQLIGTSEYRFSNPRIIGNSAAVTISGLHLYVAPAGSSSIGQEDQDQGTTWESVTNVALPASTKPANITSSTVFSSPLISSVPLNAEVTTSSGTPNDKITIGIESIVPQ